MIVLLSFDICSRLYVKNTKRDSSGSNPFFPTVKTAKYYANPSLRISFKPVPAGLNLSCIFLLLAVTAGGNLNDELFKNLVRSCFVFLNVTNTTLKILRIFIIPLSTILWNISCVGQLRGKCFCTAVTHKVSFTVFAIIGNRRATERSISNFQVVSARSNDISVSKGSNPTAYFDQHSL